MSLEMLRKVSKARTVQDGKIILLDKENRTLGNASMENMPNLKQEVCMASSVQKEQVGAVATKINITDINGGIVHFIQLDNIEDVVKHEREMNEFVENSQKEAHTPVVGELVACQFSADNVWYRATVEQVGADTASVFFPDYGNRDKAVAFDKIRRLPQCFAKLPLQAIKVSIPEVEDGTWFVDIREEVEKALTAEDGKIVLLDKDDKPIGSKAMKNTASTKQEVCMASSVPKEQVGAVATEIDITDIDGSIVHFIQRGNTEDFNKHHCELNKFFLESSPKEAHTPIVGELVACLFSEDNEWYRATVEQIGGDTASVIFNDYGNRDKAVTFDKIRHLPQRFAKLPLQAIKVPVLDTADVDNENLHKALKLVSSAKLHNGEIQLLTENSVDVRKLLPTETMSA